MSPFVAPGKEPTIEMLLFETGLIDEASKWAHAPLVEVGVVVFALRPINHVEVPCEQPWTQLERPQLMQLR
jgi:hypothetical protein